MYAFANVGIVKKLKIYISYILYNIYFQVPTNRDSEAYYTSPENIDNLDNIGDEITFSSAGDTKNIQDIMFFGIISIKILVNTYYTFV